VLEGRTSFIIAHRLSTIRSADRILVIQDGRLIEEGTHHLLMKNRSYYYRLYSNQFMENGRCGSSTLSSLLGSDPTVKRNFLRV
jgi:ABC-type transport system involved in cytochrome bd biosynthesis fused ATPase/permease subunit